MKYLGLMVLALAGCGTGTACPAGTYFRVDRCVALPQDGGPRFDAGRDASSIDAGLEDAALEDAALEDAALEDAALEDAALEDAALDAQADAGCACPAERPLCVAGACVECAGDEDCGGTICVAGECTTAVAGGASLCQECVADRHCESMMACVAIDGDSARCLWREQDLAGSSCIAGGRPLTRRVEVVREGSDSVVVCAMRISSCSALLDFDADCATVADCGRGGADALCTDADPGPSTVLHCTLPCGTNNDCPTSVACNQAQSRCML